MDRVDVHQHLLSEPLIGELARRQSPPMLTRLGGGWTLRVSGEPDSTLSLAATDTAVRGEQLRRDEVDRAGDRDAPGGGVPAPAGGPPPRRRSAAGRLRRLGGGAAGGARPGRGRRRHRPRLVGLSLPASALAGPAALERVGPLLARLEAHRVPLFVHPGPVFPPGEPAVAAALPPW